MLTYIIWKSFIEDYELIEIFVGVFLSIFSIPIDLLILPIELISLIIYVILKFIDKKSYKSRRN